MKNLPLLFPKLLVFGLCSISAILPSTAQAVSWTGTIGDWSNPSNWGGNEPTSTSYAYISNGGTANITQLNECCRELYLTGSLGGNVQMSAGSLTEETAYIGQAGVGLFSQSGGIHTSTYGFWLYSNYCLSGSGQLIGNFENIQNSLFQQLGGIHTANMVNLSTGSQYQISGGTLQIKGGLENNGTMDFCGSTGVMNATDSIINFARSGSTLKNTQSATLNIGANSLLIVPVGFTPATAFAHYSNSGIEHTIHTTLTVPAGKTILGSGIIEDPVVCQGTIAPLAGQTITMNNGLIISGNGNVRTTDSTTDGSILATNDLTSGISGGFLTTYQHVIAHGSSRGIFTQSGGTSTLNRLWVGGMGSNTGTYNLSGGQLSANDAFVGYMGTGIFNQSGGSFSISTGTLTISSANRTGTYNLTGGILIAHSIVPGGGTPYFNFGGGTIQANGDLGILSLKLTGIGGDANIDTNGFVVTTDTLTGSAGLNKRGTGILKLVSLTNNYFGDTKVFDGLLLIGSDLSQSTLDCNSYGGSVGFGSQVRLGGLKGNQNLSLNVAPEFFAHPPPLPTPVALTVGLNNKSTVYSGTLSGLGSLTKYGTGSLTLSGANSYSGGTFLVSNSTLNINNASALGTGQLKIYTASIDNTSGSPITLSTNNDLNWSGNITFIGTNDLNLGTGNVMYPLQIICLAGELTIGGTGNGYLNKSGPGTLTLTAASIYGSTIIKGGLLQIAGGINPSGSKLIDVQSGTALFKTTNVSKSDLVVQTNGSSKFVIMDGSHLVSSISGTGITQVDTGSLTATSISQNTLIIGSYGNAEITQTFSTDIIHNVPEPSTLTLLIKVALILAFGKNIVKGKRRREISELSLA